MKDTKAKEKIGIFPQSNALLILMIVTIIGEAGAVLLLQILDILPSKYFLAIIGAIIIVDIISFALMSSRKKVSVERVVGAIICAIVLVCSIAGIYYLYNTYDTLTKISKITKQKVEYSVIVNADSRYEEIGDLADKTVYTVVNNTKTYKEASGTLASEAGVEFEDVASPSEAVDKVLRGDEIRTAAVFMGRAEYDNMCQEMNRLKKKTKIIYSIKVAKPDNNNASDIDVTKDSFNLLISGIDSRVDISDDYARSDVNMIVTVNPETHTVLLTSMPRDSYVPLHMNGQMDKLTHSGVYGIDETVNTIQDWLGVKIDYYARVDFHMLRNLVDAVGGVDVYNNIEFVSHPKGWHYKKGTLHMDGSYALWFVRERKSFEDEDEQRIRNQQKVVKAIIKKLTSSKTLMSHYTDILNAVEDNMQTSMSSKDISRIAKNQLDGMPKWKIERQWVDGNDAYRGTWSMGMDRDLFVSLPKEKSVKKITKKINRVMYPTKEDKN